VRIQGIGFQASEVIDLTFDTAPVGQAVANARGKFSTSVAVPASALPGDHIVTATGESSGLQAQAFFTVRTDWTKFHFDLANTGQNPYENVLSPSTVGGLVLDWAAPTVGVVMSSPAVVDGIVYAAGPGLVGNAMVYAFDAATGVPVWSQSTGGQDTSSVTVWNGTVYVGTLTDHALHTFDAATGTPGWTFHASGAVDTPVVDRGRLFFATNAGPVYALDAKTGAVLWRQGVRDFIGTDPAIAAGLVCVGTGSTQTVVCLDEASGTPRWSAATGGIVNSSPAISGGILYVGSGDHKVYAFDAGTGGQLWTASTGGSIESGPSVAGGLVYAGSDDHSLYAFDALTGKLVWQAATGNPVFVSPVVANGVVYAGSQDYSIYAFDSATGTELWSDETGYLIGNAAAVADGALYVPDFDAHVYAFRLAP